jgi:hypothetical protein
MSELQYREIRLNELWADCCVVGKQRVKTEIN